MTLFRFMMIEMFLIPCMLSVCGILFYYGIVQEDPVTELNEEELDGTPYEPEAGGRAVIHSD